MTIISIKQWVRVKLQLTREETRWQRSTIGILHWKRTYHRTSQESQMKTRGRSIVIQAQTVKRVGRGSNHNHYYNRIHPLCSTPQWWSLKQRQTDHHTLRSNRWTASRDSDTKFIFWLENVFKLIKYTDYYHTLRICIFLSKTIATQSLNVRDHWSMFTSPSA